MLFSVITITKDDEEAFKVTCRSVLEQDFEFQWIIKDGSEASDYTTELETKSGLIIERSADTGIYDAMNQGVLIANGEYIIFMNSGDRFASKNTLTDISKLIDDRNVDVFYGNHLLNQGNCLPLRRTAKPIWQMNFRMPFSHQSCFIKKQLLTENKFKTGFGSAADYGFLLGLFDNHARFRDLGMDISIIDVNGISNRSRIKSIMSRMKFVLKGNNLFFVILRVIFNFSCLIRETIRLLTLSILPRRHH